MTEISMDERVSIRESARTLKKYGSTSNNIKRPDNYIKHQVLETDTLQGLALKYGVTTEQIRRANRLWANDSLFLRKSLLIPVSGEGLASPSDVVLLEAETDSQPHTNNNNNNNSVGGDPSYNDFLVKIDCSIASTKSQVMMSQDNSQFVDNDSLFVRRKSAMSRLRQQQHQLNHHHHHPQGTGGGGESESNCATGGGWNTEVPAVMMTQGRRVRTSLQRLEREHDDMFEL